MNKQIVVATGSFAAADVQALAGRHPGVVPPGVIQRGTRLWSDDPIVLAHPDRFVVAETLPPLSDESVRAAQSPARPSGAEWIAIVRAYRRAQTGIDERPTQAAVAANRHMAERTLSARLRGLGIDTWHAVHALVESEPES